MEINRNHYLAIGLVLVLLGIQFRCVDSLQLTPETTQFLAKRMKKKPESANPLMAILPKTTSSLAPQKTIRPPKWLGYSLLSIGAVLMVQSLGMKKPE